jgi:hypothetical protein
MLKTTLSRRTHNQTVVNFTSGFQAALVFRKSVNLSRNYACKATPER